MKTEKLRFQIIGYVLSAILALIFSRLGDDLNCHLTSMRWCILDHWNAWLLERTTKWPVHGYYADYSHDDRLYQCRSHCISISKGATCRFKSQRCDDILDEKTRSSMYAVGFDHSSWFCFLNRC